MLFPQAQQGLCFPHLRLETLRATAQIILGFHKKASGECEMSLWSKPRASKLLEKALHWGLFHCPA